MSFELEDFAIFLGKTQNVNSNDEVEHFAALLGLELEQIIKETGGYERCSSPEEMIELCKKQTKKEIKKTKEVFNEKQFQYLSKMLLARFRFERFILQGLDNHNDQS